MLECLRFKELDYILKKPDNTESGKKYPTILLMHGAGSRGRDIEMMKSNPYFIITQKHDDMGFVTFAPQCYANIWFDIFEQLGEFLDYMLTCDFVDTSRVYVMGPSMGGYATWQMAMSHCDVFAAAVPICGGGMYWNAARLQNMGVWAFHGDEDNAVFCEESKKMVDAINKCGGNAKLTIYNGRGHDSWVPTYENREVFEWLLDHKKDTITEIPKDKYDNQTLFG